MTRGDISLPQRRFGETSRPDLWWVQPLLVFLGLSTFVVYSTFRAFQGNYAAYESLLSPFYSPLIFPVGSEGAVLGWAKEHAWFSESAFRWFPLSPALLILWAPGGFRFTCYYYRGAYYKAFWADPPSCTVGEPRKKYLGEKSFPLILQNVHRYFMYLAVAFIGVLTWDTWNALWWTGADGTKSFGIHVGTVVLALNVFFLGGYTFGCHSLRHVVGGAWNVLSGRPARRKAYDCVSCLNRKHMLFAWLSLFWVGFTDLYVYLCASGTWTDFRIIGA